MNLTLQIAGQQGAALGANGSKNFDQSGGSVGRALDNDWVLPDPERFISGHHFIIRFMNNAFYLEDVSSNGVFLNGATESVRDRGDAVMLNNGDQILVGGYQIVASIAADQPMRAQVSTPSQPVPPPISELINDPFGDTNTLVDPLDMLPDKSAPVASEPPATYPDHAPAVSQHFTPPGTSTSSTGAAIPDDFEVTGFSNPASVEPPNGPPSSQIPNEDFSSDLQGSFPPPDVETREPPVPDDIIRSPSPHVSSSHQDPVPQSPSASMGHVRDDKLMIAMVQGLMDILRSRAEIKSQFRVPVTTLKPVENNPLKFCVSAEEAMRRLFDSAEPGFMTPEAAIEEGLSDIKAHQMAMMAGMRAAFQKMLERFDPVKLEQQFSARAKSGSFIGMMGKGKNWDSYVEMFSELTRDSDDSFNRLFGEAFTVAYEQQMQKLLGGSRQ